jgi:hypothetical protein
MHSCAVVSAGRACVRGCASADDRLACLEACAAGAQEEGAACAAAFEACVSGCGGTTPTTTLPPSVACAVAAAPT